MEPRLRTYIVYYFLIWPLMVQVGFAQTTNTSKAKNAELENRAASPDLNMAVPQSQVKSPTSNANTGGFQRQSMSWKEIVQLNPKMASAWKNYYESTRYSYYTATSKELNAAQQDELDEIVKEMELNISESFEYHFVKYINGNHDTKLAAHLQKAYEMQPNNVAVLQEMLAYEEIKGNASKRTEMSRALSNNREWPSGIQHFGQNLLRTLEDRSILITHGEMDTYPTLVAQDAWNERKDVQVISWDLLHSADYRKRIEKKYGISISWNAHNKSAVISQLMQSLSAKNTVYISGTFAPEVLQFMKSKLYVTGPALRYSEAEYDNRTALKRNWEKNLKLESLQKPVSDAYTRKINANYLPCLILLRQIYSDEGDEDSASKVQTLALKIAKEAGKEAQVKKAMGL